MRLRAIELCNMRRFAGRRASLSGIGDGITVLSEPNEFGKSTFFDALHALFFERHTSRNAAIRSLQPHAGGAPEATVEVELPQGRFRIAKRWLQRPQAQVSEASGRLLAQADEAEAWIDRLMGGGLAGPSGLLWVRQGLSGLEPEGSGTEDRRLRERGLAARRDLLSSVAGEIDMMTGGRRMDAIQARVAEALARLATETGRPRAGGPWKQALDEAAGLEAEEAGLRPRAERLSGDLARRTELQRSLAALTRPSEAAARAGALAQAERQHREAMDHRAQVARAEAALRLATLDHDRQAAEVARLGALSARLDAARAALARAGQSATSARARADDMARQDAEAAAAHEAARIAAQDLRTRLARASRARAARAAAAQAGDIQRRLERAGVLQAALDRARSQRAGITVTAAALSQAERAQTALDLARARAEAQAVTIEARPDGATPALLGGQPLPPGPQPVLTAVELTLPGFGSLRIDPGAARGTDAAQAIARADDALRAALAACGAETLAGARASRDAALDLDRQVAQSTAMLAEVAPDGVDALRLALAAARAAAEQAPAEGAAPAADAADPGDDPEALAGALAAAERLEHEARATAGTVHALAIEAREARAAAEAMRGSVERQFQAALAEAGDPDALPLRIAGLQADLPAMAAARDQAAQALDALRARAPDLATIEARLARALGAVQQAQAAEQRAREDLASLNATIAALAEEGIEERLSALAGARAEAEARAARYEAEVAALGRLRRALDEARTRARDAYFGPVLRELQPLLAILHPDAALTIDDASLLPATLTRNGQAETLDILSGGTREQIAILTRLAFARLFTAAGRPVPVILDDALVHSDDDRIEAMFDALHRTARDQQILVFTCRQRAFAALGGVPARVEITDG